MHPTLQCLTALAMVGHSLPFRHYVEVFKGAKYVLIVGAIRAQTRRPRVDSMGEDYADIKHGLRVLSFVEREVVEPHQAHKRNRMVEALSLGLLGCAMEDTRPEMAVIVGFSSPGRNTMVRVYPWLASRKAAGRNLSYYSTLVAISGE